MMTLKEAKTFLNSLPEKFDNYKMVNGEVGVIPNKEDDKDSEEEIIYRCDKPIVTLYVDEATKEICILHQTEDEVTDIAGKDYFSGDNTTETEK